MSTLLIKGDDEIHEPPIKRFKPNKIEISKPTAIVLDIEGTVMSKYFYENVLLPYTRHNFRDFLYENSDVEHISKRIEMIKDEYFQENPEKEQMFNDYFTESAYNEYIQRITDRQNKLNMERNENKQILLMSCDNDHDHDHDENKPIQLTESNDIIEIIDSNEPSVIILNDIDTNQNKNQSIEMIDIQHNNNTNKHEIIELSNDKNENDEDIDIIEIDKPETNKNKNEDKHEKEVIQHENVTSLEETPQINNVTKEEKKENDINNNEFESQPVPIVTDHKNIIEIDTDAKHVKNVINDENMIDHEIKDNNNQNDATNVIIIDNEEVNNKKRQLVDIISSDDDDEDIDIESSEESISTSEFSVLSKREFYREKQINLLMDIINEWFDNNIKVKPMQYLQGLIIQYGFKAKEIKSNIYNDCYDAIKKWKEINNINIYVYSHGTKDAQKLLFKYSIHGSLNRYISRYFDKNDIGNKKYCNSYRKLLREIQSEQWEDEEIASDILFISDNVLELQAAEEVGLRVLQSVREDTVGDMDYYQVSDFNQIEWIENEQAIFGFNNHIEYHNYNHHNGSHNNSNI